MTLRAIVKRNAATETHGPRARFEALDLERLDAAVQAAIAAGQPGSLRVLGYGEITLVIGWPGHRPDFAVKRLPPFRNPAQLHRYAVLLDRYMAELQQRGTAVVPTRVRSVPVVGGAVRAYLVQPLVATAQLFDEVLVSAAAERGATLLERLADRVLATVDGRLGLDAQVPNWVVQEGDRLALIDVSTPLIRSATGRQELELEPFLSIYPTPLRRLLAPVAGGVMAQYHEPRTVLLDVAANLLRERLDRWLPTLLSIANARVRPAIGEREVRRYLARDRRLWLLMQRLRRFDRAWCRLRRRPYPFLLAPPYGYGPHPVPREGQLEEGSP